LDFNDYDTPGDLREAEKLCTYPPRFKISVRRPSHGRMLNVTLKFKIILENDYALVTDEFREFPLTITEGVMSGNISIAIHMDYPLGYNDINYQSSYAKMLLQHYKQVYLPYNPGSIIYLVLQIRLKSERKRFTVH